MLPMGVSCCPTSCSVTLSLRDGKSSNVPRCLLAAASPVLNEVLSLPLATPGVLELPDDDPVAWEAVLRVLVPSPVLDMANWDNVAALLQLADKYDMAVVRAHCCRFLAARASDLGLHSDLESPNNVLRAASLVCTYGGSCELLAPYRETVLSAAKEKLGQVVRKTSSVTVCRTCGAMRGTACPCIFVIPVQPIVPDEAVRARLLELFRDPRYPTLVASEVQVELMRAVIEALKC